MQASQHDYPVGMNQFSTFQDSCSFSALNVTQQVRQCESCDMPGRIAIYFYTTRLHLWIDDWPPTQLDHSAAETLCKLCVPFNV